MTQLKVGVQLYPQHTTVSDLRRAWRDADALGIDSLWLWDHFFPISGDPAGMHFEGWTLLAAMAADTTTARVGVLVTCNSYRNPDLLADMARTVDHISGGRTVLGIGAGWFEQDYDAYGYVFGEPRDRLAALRNALPRIRSRLLALNPGPQGDLPLLIGGSGERVTLRLVAEYADWWNTFGPPGHFAQRNQVLDRWCDEVDRDRSAIHRTCLIRPEEIDAVDAYREAGVEHVIVRTAHPFELGPAERLLERAGT